MTGLLVAYHHGYGGDWSDWIAHAVVSSLIHALVYGAVFKLMHRLNLGEALVLGGVVLCCLFAWARSRDRRSYW